MTTAPSRKREPLRLPKVGEIWHTQRGRLVRVLDTEPIPTALVGDFIRRWSLVEQKAVA